MRFKLPTHPSQIKLVDYVRFKTAVDDIERAMVAVGASRSQVMAMKPETIRMIIHTYQEAAEKSDGELIRHIRVRHLIRHMRLSFIPSLESMTLAEHVDIDEMSKMVWSKGDWSYLTKMMGVLYRPKKEQLGEWYRIEKYDSEKTAHAPFIDNMTMDVVNSALLFFSTIGKRLEQSLRESLVREMKNQVQAVKKL